MDTSLLPVTVSDGRDQPMTLMFKIPSRESILVSANRLLKLETPVLRVSTMERLLEANSQSPGMSRKALQRLPLLSLETLYQALWHAVFPQSGQFALNQRISFFLLAETLQEFQPDVLVGEDIQLIGQRGTPAMHSYYYGTCLSLPERVAFLDGHGIGTDYLSLCKGDLDTVSPHLLDQAYLACRRLSSPMGDLPWFFLLGSLTREEELRFPRLGRLRAILNLLESNLAIAADCSPPGFTEALSAMGDFLASEDVLSVAQGYAQPRPLRLLVLVEGETEKLLLPLFAMVLGYDLNREGVEILPAGGKNHVARHYHDLAERLSIPICIVLDNDARSVADELGPSLRSRDQVFQFHAGEFEDAYHLAVILKTVNQHYHPYPELTEAIFSRFCLTATGKYVEEKKMASSNSQAVNGSRVTELKMIWQHYNLGTFDKVVFARQYGETLQEIFQAEGASSPLLATPEMERLIRLLFRVRAEGIELSARHVR